MIVIRLSHAEAAALSAACLYADGKHRHPALQEARAKLRIALDKPTSTVSESERYVNTEC